MDSYTALGMSALAILGYIVIPINLCRVSAGDLGMDMVMCA